jgi:hypothetical protein
VLRAAWKLDAKAGMARIRKLAEWLDRDYPSAAASLLEGLEECFTINRLGLGYTHLVTADDVRVAGELGALLDKEFFAQDLPKFPPNAEKASGKLTEAV